MKKFSTPTKVFFIVLFTAAVFASTKVNLAQLAGKENQFFTLFQLFGPVAGGILGSVFGAAIVLCAEIVNLAVNVFRGTNGFEPVNVLRLLPMVFAAYYFGTRRKHVSVAVPILAIASFVSHPVGREVWYYSLFWTIPIVAAFFRNKLFIRSLGATFTAHAVGGAVWIWAFPTSPAMWMALIPVVIVERLLFASGISLSYVFANTLLHRLESKVPFINVSRQYVLEKRCVLSKRVYKYFF